MKESCLTHKQVMSHVWMSRVTQYHATHIHESFFFFPYITRMFSVRFVGRFCQQNLIPWLLYMYVYIYTQKMCMCIYTHKNRNLPTKRTFFVCDFVCALFTHCWIDLFVFQDILFMDFVINILFLDFVRGTNIAGWRRRTGFLIFGGVFFGTSFCVKMRRA